MQLSCCYFSLGLGFKTWISFALYFCYGQLSTRSQLLLTSTFLDQVHLMPSQQTEVETEKTTLMRKELHRVPELQKEQPEVLERLLLLWQNIQVRGCT